MEALRARQDPSLGDPVLDNAAWAALTGPQAHLAQRVGLAARFDPEVAPFVALEDHHDPQAWLDAATLVGRGGTFAVAGEGVRPPEGWDFTSVGGGVQLVDVDLTKEPDPEARLLGESDVPEMLELIERTRPGPFRPRTVELGGYLGIRRDGDLIAMAGRRMHPRGWIEISAVCTDVAFRGQGLGARLVRAVAAGIVADGEKVFLHTAAGNTTAIRLYESIGFRLRRVTDFLSVTVPEQ
ncbi:GNAT family N-acetyltransferase [Nakamurella sp. UYEF19]|uniref:GNAT family N-acetyltransferase n=1 Tax=Nakamurella sp. UYEF19 TaxID=1756392 RepID=UPI003398BF19